MGSFYDVAFVIAAGNDRMFASSAKVLGHPEWATDTRFSAAAPPGVDKKALIIEMRKVILTQTRDFWIDKLTAADVPCAPIHNLGELAAANQFTHMDMTQILPECGVKVVGLPISFDRERPRSMRSAPKLGEHTQEVLAELNSRRSQ
jgi:crotonobetainyl-CoA:carnitine CoA-transferase CaiB-like acyl-CoA transferase